MHKLVRQVRFSINPFLDETDWGFNSYSAKPTGQGLAIFFALRVGLECKPNEDTGFVVNVTEIDSVVRNLVVPVFDEAVKRNYRNRKHISLGGLCELLDYSKIILSEHFAQMRLSELTLELNPVRIIGIVNFKNGGKMICFSEKFDFAAMHKLWNDKFSEKQNFEAFGKCANAAGHGHNYEAEVVVVIDENKIDDFSIAGYQKAVKENFVDFVDHKNLNADVEYFKHKNPTVENIAAFAFGQLKGKFTNSRLDKITIWETERTSCTYSE
jgi:6-pyruvoyltetrahydropterin/6-carboxytetrahydropterin synthase